jgi:hypothetical protein
MNLVGDLIYLVAAMVQVTPQQHNQQICGKLTGLFHPPSSSVVVCSPISYLHQVKSISYAVQFL